MKIGTHVLYKSVDQGWTEGYVVDFLPSSKMICIGYSKYQEPIYYRPLDYYKIKVIKESE